MYQTTRSSIINKFDQGLWFLQNSPIYMTISNYLNIVLVFDAKLKLKNSKWLNLFLKDNMHRNFLAVVLF